MCAATTSATRYGPASTPAAAVTYRVMGASELIAISGEATAVMAQDTRKLDVRSHLPLGPAFGCIL